MLKYYNELASHVTVKAKREELDWEKIYETFGEMADDIRAQNTPTTVTDAVDPEYVEKCWPKIREIIKSVPSYEECLEIMKRAGCKTTLEEIGKSEELFNKCVKYSPFMRRRLTLLRMQDMIEV
jgi:glycerol-1-phosphate dehydrogenase [NAD(P)+]